MKKNIFFIICFLFINSCCKEQDKKPCDSCPYNTSCLGDSCVPNKGFYYNTINGKREIVQIFLGNYSNSNICVYTNFSFRDTPWITPRDLAFFRYQINKDINAGGNALKLSTNNNVNSTEYSFALGLSVIKNMNGRVKRVILYQDVIDEIKLMKNDSIKLPYTRTIWDGIVSEDYNQINFTIKFIRPQFLTYGKWNDTFKVINNYIMTKDSTNKSNCTFCD